MKRNGMILALLLLQQLTAAQTLTFLFRNAQSIPGPKFRYEVWLKSSNGTSRMGSVLVYNNYNVNAFGPSVVANGRVTVTKNAVAFGSSYGQNANNDNASGRFAYSWTFLGAPGTGSVIPSSGDGVLAFTVEIDIANSAVSSALTFEGSLMNGEQYLDDEFSVWPSVDATDILDDPLPIQLASFTAIVTTNNQVRLEWRTISEVNNYGFEVQRKRTNEQDYHTLANSFIPGHGTTNEPHEYSFTDSTVTAGEWHYRLRQIDLDGTIHFTEPINSGMITSVKEEPLPTVYSLDQNYPNPFNPSTRIQYALPQAGRVKLTVYNTLGQLVATLVDETRSAGRFAVDWNFVGMRSGHLTSGVYFYRIDVRSAGHSQFTTVKKMVLMK